VLAGLSEMAPGWEPLYANLFCKEVAQASSARTLPGLTNTFGWDGRRQRGGGAFQSQVGFFIHVTEIYDFFFLSLYSHCGSRDSKGGKTTDSLSLVADAGSDAEVGDLVDAAYWDSMVHDPSLFAQQGPSHQA